MIVFLPRETIDKSAEFLHPVNLLGSAMAATEILSVRHETHSLSSELQHHPSCVQYSGHEIWLAHVGLTYIEAYTAKMIETNQPLHKVTLFRVSEILQAHFSLASSDDEIDLTPPPWMGKPEFHEAHRRWLLTMFPINYPELLADAEWAGSPRLFA